MSIVKDLLLISLSLILFIQYVILHKKMIKQRDFFINTLSHDLRVSAIAQIRGVELLEKEVQSNLITEIKNSCLFSLDMINMLLNTYRYDKGEEILRYEEFNFAEKILSSCKNLSNLIQEKKLKLHYNMDNLMNVRGDKTGLQKVFSTLLTIATCNAKKGTSVSIIAKKIKNRLNVSIVYTGFSLSEEERKRMFSENSRFSTVGHGIKMLLCKKIIAFHKGEININSLENEQNSFSFSIPISDSQKTSNTLTMNTFQPSRL